MENKKEGTFHYTYSAKQQEEIRAIRKKYSVTEEKEDKMAQLRRLDAGVTQKAQCRSLTLGVIGALILGFGMSLVMTDLGTVFGLRGGAAVLLGILFGTVGILLVCLAYPLYHRIVKRERKKIAPAILRLADELMQGGTPEK